jgi:hypothetical protein
MRVRKSVLIVIPFLLLAFASGLILGWDRGKVMPIADRYVRIWRADEPPPPWGTVAWYYKAALVPAWRLAVWENGWLDASRGGLPVVILPPHDAWFYDPIKAVK